jgi:hypothetical protein
MRESKHGPDHVLAAIALSSMAEAYANLGDPEEAMALWLRVLGIWPLWPLASGLWPLASGNDCQRPDCPHAMLVHREREREKEREGECSRSFFLTKPKWSALTH